MVRVRRPRDDAQGQRMSMGCRQYWFDGAGRLVYRRYGCRDLDCQDRAQIGSYDYEGYSLFRPWPDFSKSPWNGDSD